MRSADVLSMQAGRELDRLVAERVMGWTKVGKNEQGMLVGEPPEAKAQGRTWAVPFWSLDYTMAWQVADVLAREGWQLSVQYEPETRERGEWTVGLDRGECHAAGSGANWPEALCRAAVAAAVEGDGHDVR